MDSGNATRPLALVADQARHDAVLAELDRILASAAFRGTRRSQEFLRYIVNNALDGRPECLKERSIGVDVFGRPADYDTGDDSIVRVKASEVRKRLAQYYRDATPSPVQIDLPPGAYAPEFRFGGVPGPVDGRPDRRRFWLGAGAIALVGAGLVTMLLWPRATPPIDDFWRPVLADSRPVLVCVAHPAVYRLGEIPRAAFEAGTPPESVAAADITRDTEHFIGFGDALALAHLSAFFARAGRPVELRLGNDVTFAELRNTNAVLIGAFTNQWTVEITKDLRFAFERTASGMVIRDRLTSETWKSGAKFDYAVVTRMFNSKSGGVAMTAAGLSHYGTQMAGEFLISPARVAEAMRAAPADWRSRNLQLVLEAEVIGRTPGPPRVVASYFW